MKYSIPLSERPITKLQYFGSSALSNSELISLILGSGTKDKTSLELADAVLECCEGDLSSFGTLYVAELREVYGVGNAKAASLVAAVELGKRIASSKAAKTLYQARSPQDVAALLMNEYRDERQEHFLAIYLDGKGRFLSRKTVSIGSLTYAMVHPRDVFAPAIKLQAQAVIVAHNHPSGDPSPSREDIEVTERLKQAGEIVGIKLLDHIILGRGCFESMKQNGFLDSM